MAKEIMTMMGNFLSTKMYLMLWSLEHCPHTARGRENVVHNGASQSLCSFAGLEGETAGSGTNVAVPRLLYSHHLTSGSLSKGLWFPLPPRAFMHWTGKEKREHGIGWNPARFTVSMEFRHSR